MERYKNIDGDSGVTGYEVGADFIRVQFSTGAVYLYTYESAGVLVQRELENPVV